MGVFATYPVRLRSDMVLLMQVSGSNSPYQSRFLINHDSGSPVRVRVGGASPAVDQPQSEPPTDQSWSYLAASIGCDRVATALETTPDL